LEHVASFLTQLRSQKCTDSGVLDPHVRSPEIKHSTGNKNIALGFKAGTTLVHGNNNIYIGNPGNGDESKTMRLGSGQTQTFIAGINTATVSGATVEIDANGQLGLAPSSARYKRDIAAMGSRSENVLQLRPVTFAYKEDAQGMKHYGLIAEEVAAIYPELVTHTATGEVQAVRYQELIPMLLNELQRQRQELAELRALVGQGHRAEASVASKP
jgi:endosialidase-like protein